MGVGADFALTAVLTANIAGFKAALTNAAGSLEAFKNSTGNNFEKIGNLTTGLGKALTLGVTTPLATIGAASLKTFGTFEKQMNRVKAISGATGNEFEALKKQAIDLGASSVFSATEVAQAQEVMASAGMSAADMLKHMSGVMDLAAISGGDMALAGEAVASALNQFSAQGLNASHVADVYAKAAADTNAETQDMAEAMKYAGPVMGSLGTTFEETAAAIGIMSNAGIKGSQAGTTLRTAMLRLASPSKKAAKAMARLGIEAYDSEGKMKPLSALLPHLREKLAGLSEEERNFAIEAMFGKESISGMLALLNTSPQEFDKMVKGLQNADGAAKEMADTMNSGLAGAIEELKGKLETAGIAIGERLAPYVQKLSGFIGDLIDKFNALSDKQKDQVIKWGLIATAAGPFLMVLGKLIAFLPMLVNGFKLISGVFSAISTAFASGEGIFGAIGTALAGISAPIWLIIGAVAAFVAALIVAWNTNKEFRSKIIEGWNAIVEAVSPLIDSIKNLITSFFQWLNTDGKGVLEGLKQAWQGFLTTVQGIWQAIVGVIQIATGVIKGIIDVFTAVMKGDWSAAWEAIKEAGANIWKGIENLFGGLFEALKGILNVGLGVLKAAWELVWGAIVAVFRVIWNTIVAVAKAGWELLKGVWNLIVDGSKAIWDGLTSFLGGIWDGITEAWTAAWETISTTISSVWQGIVDTVMTILNPFIETLKTIWESVAEPITQAWEGIKQIFTGAWEFIKSIVLGAILIILDLITGNFTQLQEDLNLIWTSITEAINTVWTGIQNFFTGIITAIVEGAKAIWQGFQDFMSGLWEGIKNAASSAWEWIKSTVTNLINGTVNTAKSVWEGFKSFLSGLWEGIKSLFSGAWNAITSTVTGAVNNIVSTAQNAWNSFTNGVQNLVNGVSNIFNSLFNIDLWGAGQAIMNGFLGGLQSMWDSITSFVGGIADWIRNNKGPIQKDRKLLIPAGKAIMAGLGGGLTTGFRQVKSDVTSMAGTIAGLVDSGISNSLTGDYSQMVNNTVQSGLSLELNKPAQPLQVTLSLGGRDFVAFVDDVTNTQQAQARLSEAY